MRKVFGLFLVLGLAVVPALAQKINIDYAHDFDFSEVKTFQYVPSKDHVSKDPLMDGRIHDKILTQLRSGKLEEVESDPDLFITYHLASKENTVLNTTGMGYGGYGMGWGGWGGGMTTSTTTVSTYTEGTLIIDAYEPGEKKMVWRGTGTVTLKSKPEKVAKQIDNILAKMGSKWQKILQGIEKEKEK